jgi:AcrR family transcriptional regulator
VTDTIELATAADGRPYHHGDLRQALIQAARAIVIRDGAQALSLRGVAREAGVSPAAPYHHFKDKQELVFAVGQLGFEELGVVMEQALAQCSDTPHERLTTIGVAYVLFARDNPALYRLMYDCTRNMEALPPDVHEKDHSAYAIVRAAIIAAGLAETDDPVGIELATTAAWCAAHGVAEMGGFAQFDPLKAAVGGELAFYRELLKRTGAFSAR